MMSTWSCIRPGDRGRGRTRLRPRRSEGRRHLPQCDRSSRQPYGPHHGALPIQHGRHALRPRLLNRLSSRPTEHAVTRRCLTGCPSVDRIHVRMKGLSSMAAQVLLHQEGRSGCVRPGGRYRPLFGGRASRSGPPPNHLLTKRSECRPVPGASVSPLPPFRTLRTGKSHVRFSPSGMAW
jgi:hypothetical protein